MYRKCQNKFRSYLKLFFVWLHFVYKSLQKVKTKDDLRVRNLRLKFLFKLSSYWSLQESYEINNHLDVLICETKLIQYNTISIGQNPNTILLNTEYSHGAWFRRGRGPGRPAPVPYRHALLFATSLPLVNTFCHIRKRCLLLLWLFLFTRISECT